MAAIPDVIMAVSANKHNDQTLAPALTSDLLTRGPVVQFGWKSPLRKSEVQVELKSKRKPESIEIARY